MVAHRIGSLVHSIRCMLGSPLLERETLAHHPKPLFKRKETVGKSCLTRHWEALTIDLHFLTRKQKASRPWKRLSGPLVEEVTDPNLQTNELALQSLVIDIMASSLPTVQLPQWWRLLTIRPAWIIWNSKRRIHPQSSYLRLPAFRSSISSQWIVLLFQTTNPDQDKSHNKESSPPEELMGGQWVLNRAGSAARETEFLQWTAPQSPMRWTSWLQRENNLADNWCLTAKTSTNLPGNPWKIRKKSRQGLLSLE